MVYAFAALAVFSPLIHIFAAKLPRTKEIFIDLYLKYFLFWIVGVFSVVLFLGNFFMPNFFAENIGWKPGSPFQFEVAVAYLGYGAAGLIALKQRLSFAFAVLICWGIFSFGSGLGLAYQLQVNQEYTDLNAGPIFYSNFIFPIAGMILYWLKRRISESETGVI